MQAVIITYRPRAWALHGKKLRSIGSRLPDKEPEVGKPAPVSEGSCGHDAGLGPAEPIEESRGAIGHSHGPTIQGQLWAPLLDEKEPVP
jgi:hypothetical protein